MTVDAVGLTREINSASVTYRWSCYLIGPLSDRHHPIALIVSKYPIPLENC